MTLIKVPYVHVKPLHFKLSEEAKTIHNEYEDITKLHAANNFLTGDLIKLIWFLVLTVTLNTFKTHLTEYILFITILCQCLQSVYKMVKLELKKIGHSLYHRINIGQYINK